MDDDHARAAVRSEFDEAICALLPGLYRRALALTGSPYAAEDALHDAYIKLAARPERMMSHPEPCAYALATLVNVVRDGWRRRDREVSLPDLSGFPLLTGDGGIQLREAQLEVLRLLAQLTPRQAGVVLLVDIDGFTLDQAAQALGLHRGTVAITRTRALRKLRHVLGRGLSESAEVHREPT